MERRARNGAERSGAERRTYQVTYNSGLFTRDTWPKFRMFVKGLRKSLHARAWTACWEQSLNSDGKADDDDDDEEPAPERYHGHAYLYWPDGDGVALRNLDELKFEDNGGGDGDAARGVAQVWRRSAAKQSKAKLSTARKPSKATQSKQSKAKAAGGFFFCSCKGRRVLVRRIDTQSVVHR